MIFLFSDLLHSQSYGLQFSSHEVVPEKRTSLNLTPKDPLCLKENTQISFDFTFVPNQKDYFGYVVRIITATDQNIDIVYNQKLRKFNFVIGESFSNNFLIDSSKLFGDWNHCVILFDNKIQEVVFTLNNQFICKSKLNFNTTTCYKILFGANSMEKFMTIDVPPMRLKDISISTDKKQKYFYPLSENNGNQSTDNIDQKTALVNNPVWISPRHQNWNQVNTIVVAGNPSVAFDKNKEIIYIVSADSLYQLSFKNNQLTGSKLEKKMLNLQAGNQSIFDNSFNKLYNFFIDQQLVSSFNPADNTWQEGPYNYKLTEFWQANKFISTLDNGLYIFGGYGQLQYKNQVQRFGFSDQKWELLKSNGDFFMPRYLAALGVNARTDTAFIIGGYGSKSGDQTINPKYTYDLMAYSVSNNSFKHVFSFKQPKNQFCFSNSLVIDSTSTHFYGLIYPIDRFNSSLQLIKGSLSSPEYELVGDSMPFLFHDIESFSDLYYCPSSKKLVAVTILSPKKQPSVIKIFTLDFPPNKLVSTSPQISNFKKSFWLFAITILVFFIPAIYFVLKKRRNRVMHTSVASIQEDFKHETVSESIVNNETISNHGLYETELVTSSIFLFGHFEVIDKDGNDITRLFSPLLKEMFLLILFYTIKDGKGISSDKIYEILWTDKPIKDARNNYYVNVQKLKTILEKVGETNISKETGKWRFEILNETIRIDYQQFIDLANNKQPVIDKNYITELLSIINKGAFLREVQYDWMDDFKSTVSDFIITTILSYTSKANLQKDTDFILKLTNCIFHFDQMNEEALSLKCRCLIIVGRQVLAKETYLNFSKEFKKNYGKEFGQSFSEIIG